MEENKPFILDGERIRWREKSDKKVHAFNDKGEWLGYLSDEMVGRHKHFCWYQTQGIRLSPGCLQEVRDTQKLLLKRRKLKNRTIQWRDIDG